MANGKKLRISAQEVDYLLDIDKSIVEAIMRVDETRLRKYVRNWASELTRKQKGGVLAGIRSPKKE